MEIRARYLNDPVLSQPGNSRKLRRFREDLALEAKLVMPIRADRVDVAFSSDGG